MARITVEDCLDQVPNRFSLVLLVSKRAKQLLKGAEAQVNTPNNKPVVVALREVAIGAIHFDASETLDAQIEKDLKNSSRSLKD